MDVIKRIRELSTEHFEVEENSKIENRTSCVDGYNYGSFADFSWNELTKMSGVVLAMAFS